MKNNHYSCMKAVFRKNITRFAPFWGLYALGMVLGFAAMANWENKGFYFSIHLVEAIRIMVPVNLVYGFLTAQLLWGDLFDMRLCSGIHSLPLRREQLFAAHLLTGLLVSLIPDGIMALSAIPVIAGQSVVNGWQIPLLWLLASQLQYLLFFGTALFCVFCTGSRLGMAVLYGCLNFGSILLYFLVDSLYIPMLYGVAAPGDLLYRLCPLSMMTNTYIDIQRAGNIWIQPYAWTDRFTPADGWDYLWAAAAVGAVLILAALLIYRKRDLERAGSFVAVPGLKPILGIVLALLAGAAAQLFGILLLGDTGWIILVMLFGGLTVGWFLGQMLLEKTTRIFTLRSAGILAILAVALGTSLVMTRLDVLGIESWVPDENQVASAAITNYYGEYEYDDREHLPLTEPDQIRDLLTIHQAAIDGRLDRHTALSDPEGRRWVDATILYELKSGRRVLRRYVLWGDEPAAQTAKCYLSDPDEILGDLLPLRDVDFLEIENYQVPEEYLTQKDLKELEQALLADCREGTLAPQPGFHQGWALDFDGYTAASWWFMVGFRNPEWADEGDTNILGVSVFPDSRHTVAWMDERGLRDAVTEQNRQYYE